VSGSRSTTGKRKRPAISNRINTLPKWARQYIHHVHTFVGAPEVEELMQLRDERLQLIRLIAVVRGRTEGEYGRILVMALCRVSYTDTEGLAHAIDVEAESLYEAVALAVAEFRHDELNQSMPGAMTEFAVLVYRQPTQHRIRLNQVTKWAEHTVKDGPAGILKRQKVRSLLGVKE
jgi:hypothetical protein